MKSSPVAILPCSEYKAETIKSQLETLTKNSDFPEVAGKTVLLKPNILSGAAPEKAVCTHPEFLRGVIRLVREKGAGKILVGDSPGAGGPEHAARKAGLLQVVEEEGAFWASFKKSSRFEAPGGRKQKQFFLTSWLKEADILISLPKMKTHIMMYFTGAVKNLFGLVPGLNKSRFHMNYPEKEDFAALICDLYETVKPDYAIMDAITAMEGPGPGSGYPKAVNLILASANAAALDGAAMTIMGYDPLKVPIMKEILARGRNLAALDEIHYPLLDARELVIPDYKRVTVLKDTGFFKKAIPKGMYNFLKDLYVPRPFFKPSPCILCLECVKICPPGALGKAPGKSKKKIIIDRAKCIRCYCCHEVCPRDAITIGRLPPP